MMEYLRKSTTSVRRTCKSLERKVTQVQNDFLLYKDQQENQSTEFRHSLDYTSEQIETLEREKADLTRKVNGLKKDNIEQHSRRRCLVLMGIEEEREQNTDEVIPEFCRDNLGITILESQLDRSHRLVPPKFDDKGKKLNCPIIEKFRSYRTRELIFSNKKKLKKNGFLIHENLTKRKMELFTQAKKIVGVRNVWTKGGNIFSFNKQNKVFVIRSSKDLDNLNVSFNYVAIVFPILKCRQYRRFFYSV